MTDSAIGTGISPGASMGAASDVSQLPPSNKDEGLSNGISIYYITYRHLNFNIYVFTFFMKEFLIAKISTHQNESSCTTVYHLYIAHVKNHGLHKYLGRQMGISYDCNMAECGSR